MAAPPGLRKWAAHVVTHRHPSPARLLADRIIRPGCRYHVARDSRLRCLASCRGHVGTARHPARVCGAGATRQAPRCGQSPSRRLRSLCLGAVWARSLFSGRGSALCTEACFASSPAPTHGCQQLPLPAGTATNVSRCPLVGEVVLLRSAARARQARPGRSCGCVRAAGGVGRPAALSFVCQA